MKTSHTEKLELIDKIMANLNNDIKTLNAIAVKTSGLCENEESKQQVKQALNVSINELKKVLKFHHSRKIKVMYGDL